MSDAVFAKRHSAAHVLAAAVKELFGEGVQFGVGPVVEHGFYYDMLVPGGLSDADLPKIEEKMREIIERDEAFERTEIDIDAAITHFTQHHQPFKQELLRDLKEKGTTRVSEEEQLDVGDRVDAVSLYTTGAFVDLCRGPHIRHSKEIGEAFRLTKLAGAYWRGKEENPQLQRVYGVLFDTKQELDAYLTMQEEAKKRDHRKLGQELDLFTLSPLVGPGLPLFTPKGTLLREQLQSFVWHLMKPYGYERVHIPHMAKADLYKTSGHWEKFSDDIFHISSKKTDEAFVMKPMNCPHHTQIYASRPRSYRDLPLRFSEVTAVYRDENTGQLQGLTRVRSITQDDAHVFCRMDQVHAEALAIYDIITQFYAAFQMPLSIRLSTHNPDEPEKYLGGNEVWQHAEETLAGLLQELGKEYEVGVGEAAFYGPKIDFIATDAIGRKWQLATIQLDFNLPERFDLTYVDAENTKVRPVMIHRAILGSIERFMGVIIEHYAGAFPLWLAPVQVCLANVSDEHLEHTYTIAAQLKAAGVRVEVDSSNEKVGKKIRQAAINKIPWTIVVGQKEVDGGDVQVNVFGSEERRVISQTELLSVVLQESQFPAKE